MSSTTPKFGHGLVIKEEIARTIALTPIKKDLAFDMNEFTSSPKKISPYTTEKGNKTFKTKLTNTDVKEISTNLQKSPTRSNLRDRNANQNSVSMRLLYKEQGDPAILS